MRVAEQVNIRMVFKCLMCKNVYGCYRVGEKLNNCNVCKIKDSCIAEHLNSITGLCDSCKEKRESEEVWQELKKIQ